MNKCVLAVLLMTLSTTILAQNMTPREAKCYEQTKEEADFIISRINRIHRDYENKIHQSGLGQFKSGAYSTDKLLDNTIRRYHRKLIRQIKNYPVRYASRLRHAQHRKHTVCQARKLQDSSVGTIHEFDLSWQRAIREAGRNARYFKQMNDLH